MTASASPRDPSILSIAPGVTVLRHPHVEGNTGLVVGSKAALVIDTGPGRGHRALIHKVLQTVEAPHVATILTHGHWDHVLGGGFGPTTYAHVETANLMRAALSDMSRISGRQPSEIETNLPWPTLTISKRQSIELGSRTVDLIPTPGHSPDSICVLVQDCGVLFGGDTVVTCIPPVFRDGNSRQLESTLSALAQIADISTIVPGHGRLVTGNELGECLEWPLSYIRSLRSAISRLAPATEEALLKVLTYEKYIGKRFDRNKYRMDWRHGLTIRTLLTEILPT